MFTTISPLIILLWRPEGDIRAILWAEAGLCPWVGREPWSAWQLSPLPISGRTQCSMFPRHPGHIDGITHCITQAPTHTTHPHFEHQLYQARRQRNWMWAWLLGSIWRERTWMPDLQQHLSLPEVCPEHRGTRGEAQGDEVQAKFRVVFQEEKEKSLSTEYCNYLYTWWSPPLWRGQAYSFLCSL